MQLGLSICADRYSVVEMQSYPHQYLLVTTSSLQLSSIFPVPGEHGCGVSSSLSLGPKEIRFSKYRVVTGSFGLGDQIRSLGKVGRREVQTSFLFISVP